MKVLVCTVAMGSWYPQGAARLAESLKGAGVDFTSYQNAPPGTPMLGEYTPYAAKPFALRESCRRDYDVVVLCDASFYLINPIKPMVDHIIKNGYYLCRNGSTVGEWATDLCLQYFGLSREEAMGLEDVSSYCVGISTRDADAFALVERWAANSTSTTICGHHTNMMHGNRRTHNRGWVSQDKRVKGHRHDQTVLSIIAHQNGLLNWSSRPYLTTYKGSETADTVFACEGMGAGS